MEKEIRIHLLGNIPSTNSKKAQTLLERNFFGEKSGEKINYSLFEAYYLIEKGIAEIVEKDNSLTETEIQKKFLKIDNKFQTKYVVFRDLRKKGYILKSGLKFGGEFTVYKKGEKPGKNHSKWILFTEDESNKFSWHEFSSKNRVAHSTKKNLLIAVVDKGEKPLYFEVSWTKLL